jgi:murein DD-endopeptidase MepM/ murein hydrolase activator NlpD
MAIDRQQEKRWLINRRNLLKVGGLALLGVLLPANLQAQATPFRLPFDGSPSFSTWYLRQWYGNTRWAYRQRHALYSQGQGLHFGLDFFTPCGSVVLAIADGTVTAVDGPYGSAPHNLVIRHTNGYASLYGHLRQRATLQIGEKIKQGQAVAISGAPSGADCDTHPHLHLEIRTGDMAGTVNPVPLIAADWFNLTLGLAGEGLAFELDLDNPTRWQSIYEQPAVRFGSALLNNYARPWPLG